MTDATSVARYKTNPGHLADRYQIRAVQRALAVLLTFTEAAPALSLAEISRHTRLDRGTIFRLLRSLEASGFVQAEPDRRRYRLGPQVLHLAQVYLAGWDIRGRAVSFLQQLRDRFQESVGLAIRAGDQRVFIEKAESVQGLTRVLEIGVPVPLYADAPGKAILAFLPTAEREALVAEMHLVPFTERTVTDREQLHRQLEQIRAHGYAVTSGERIPGVIGVSAPVFDPTGRVIGSICISMPIARCSKSLIPELARAVVAAAGAISGGAYAAVDESDR